MIKFSLVTEIGIIGFSEKTLWQGEKKAIKYMEQLESRKARLLVFNSLTGKFEPRVRFQYPTQNRKAAV